MENNLQNKNVIAYSRVSTKDQKDFGNSLTVQKNRIVDFCQLKNMSIIKSFNDDFSAKDFNRPAFKELKAYVKTTKVDYILVQKWDRFSRNVGKALLMIEAFKKLGIEVNCTENWIDYNAPDHIVILSIYLSTPEAENSKISERTRAGTRQALKEGRYVKSIPKGYEKGLNLEGKSLIKPNPKTGPLVTQLFQDYSKGLYSQQELIKIYNRKGLDINKSVLSRMLDNPLYMGMVKVPAYKEELETLVKGQHIALISKETFNLVQSVKHGKRKVVNTRSKKNEAFPLVGFLDCFECGNVICGSKSNNGKKKKITRSYEYYQCNSKYKCSRYRAEYINKELLKIFKKIKSEIEVLDLFQEILIDEYHNTQKERKKDLIRLQKEIDVIEENQLLIAEKFSLDKINETIYNKLTKNYELQLIDLKASMTELGDYQKDLDKYLSFGMSLITNLDKLYENSSIEVKVRLLGSIFVGKLKFHKNSFRTLPFSEAITVLGKYNKGFQRILKKKGDVHKNISRFVPRAGIEPVCIFSKILKS